MIQLRFILAGDPQIEICEFKLNSIGFTVIPNQHDKVALPIKIKLKGKDIIQTQYFEVTKRLICYYYSINTQDIICTVKPCDHQP